MGTTLRVKNDTVFAVEEGLCFHRAIFVDKQSVFWSHFLNGFTFGTEECGLNTLCNLEVRLLISTCSAHQKWKEPRKIPRHSAEPRAWCNRCGVVVLYISVDHWFTSGDVGQTNH